MFLKVLFKLGALRGTPKKIFMVKAIWEIMWFLLLSWKLQLHFKTQDKSHGNKIYLILFNPAFLPTNPPYFCFDHWCVFHCSTLIKTCWKLGFSFTPSHYLLWPVNLFWMTIPEILQLAESVAPVAIWCLNSSKWIFLLLISRFSSVFDFQHFYCNVFLGLSLWAFLLRVHLAS